MQRSFADDQVILDRILAQIENIDGVVRLQPDGVTLKDRQKVPADEIDGSVLNLRKLWLALCGELKERKLESVYLWPDNQTIEVVQCSYGNVSGGFAYGFLYAKHPRGEILKNLDEAPEKRGRYLAPTGRKDWYLFLRIDG